MGEWAGVKCPWSGIEIEECSYVLYEGSPCVTNMDEVCPVAKIIGILKRAIELMEEETST